MADDLSFTISAEDQASKAVETVQKKIQNFGSDVAKMALGVAGPMALLQVGIGYVTDKWTEYKKAQEEAFEKGASGTYEELKAQEKYGEKLADNLSILLAIKKLKDEKSKNQEDIQTQQDQAIKAFKETKAGQDFVAQHTRYVSDTGQDVYTGTRAQELAAAQIEGNRLLEEKKKKDAEAAAKKAEEDKAKAKEKELPELAKLDEQINATQKRNAQGGDLKGQDKIDDLTKEVNLAERYYQKSIEGSDNLIEQRKALLKLEEARGALMDEKNKQSADQAKIDAQAAAQKKKEDEDLAKALANKKDVSSTLTVSSLREIGGSFGRGGDVSSAIDQQVQLAQKSVDALNIIAKNTEPRIPDTKPEPVGNTNFTG